MGLGYTWHWSIETSVPLKPHLVTGCAEPLDECVTRGDGRICPCPCQFPGWAPGQTNVEWANLFPTLVIEL